MANIILKDINKIYPNNVHAVYDFNIEISDKEFIVFVGPSGCGKSTTLRMIAGLEEITTGEFYIDGKLMNYILPKDRNVSMVFQNYALYPHMSVYKNMAYGLSIKKEYLPVYEKNEEIASLISEVKKHKYNLASIVKKMSKNEGQEDLKKSYDEEFVLVLNALNKIDELRKPVLGIDAKRIKRLNKDIDYINKEICYIQNLIDNEIKADTKDEELINMYKSDVENFSKLLKEKENELEEAKKEDTPILKYRHMYDYEIDKEVYHAADILDLKYYLARLPNALSGGQRQRVALGRAIVRRPKVFLMDEPLSNLDAKLRVQTRGEILNLHKRVGATTIYVTHDQTEAMTLADRIVIMKDGYVQQIAKPMDAFNDPANIFVAGFIGSPAMNFIHGKYQNGEFISNSGVIKLTLNNEHKELLEKAGKENIVLGIRPEHILMKDKKGKNSISLNVDSIELLGSEFVLYTKTNDEFIAVKTTEPVNPSLRGEINFEFKEDKLYFFDEETTLRIK